MQCIVDASIESAGIAHHTRFLLHYNACVLTSTRVLDVRSPPPQTAMSSTAKRALAMELSNTVAEARLNAVEPLEENEVILCEAMQASKPHNNTSPPPPTTAAASVARGGRGGVTASGSAAAAAAAALFARGADFWLEPPAAPASWAPRGSGSGGNGGGGGGGSSSAAEARGRRLEPFLLLGGGIGGGETAAYGHKHAPSSDMEVSDQFRRTTIVLPNHFETGQSRNLQWVFDGEN